MGAEAKENSWIVADHKAGKVEKGRGGMLETIAAVINPNFQCIGKLRGAHQTVNNPSSIPPTIRRRFPHLVLHRKAKQHPHTTKHNICY